MDANGLRFWMLARERDWVTGPDADYDPARRRLRLRSGRVMRPAACSAFQGFSQGRTPCSRSATIFAVIRS